jgi:signal transduction histidine kinase
MAATDECTPEHPTCRVAYRVSRPDGPVVWLEKSGYAFFDEKGKMVRMIGMVADITEQKLAEEALSSLSRKLIEAQETERARIARDLHDDISQRLALVAVMVEQMKHGTSAENGGWSRVNEISQQIADIAASVHDLSHELHSSALRLLDMAGAIRSFCTELSEKQKVEIDVVCKDVPENVTKDISLCLFRVLQEALHNAVKYSTVRRFEVELRGTSDAIHLTIRDFGIGFDPETAMKRGGLGLSSMRERLTLVAGEFSIDSQPNHGTTVHAYVPLGRTSVSNPVS